MPNSTLPGSERRAPSQSRSKGRDASVDSREATTEKFPDFEASSTTYNSSPAASGRSASKQNGYSNGSAAFAEDNWRPRSQSSAPGGKWLPSLPGQSKRGHGRQKSIVQDTFREIRVRGGSVNAQQVAGALRAPVSPRLIVRNPQIPGSWRLGIGADICNCRYYVSCGTPPRP